MDTQYVIVVEVDNRRALAAYNKGITELDEIWPEIMLHADKVEAIKKKYMDDESDRLKSEWDEYKRKQKEYDAYRDALMAWNRGSAMFRGPKPAEPPYPHVPMLSMNMGSGAKGCIIYGNFDRMYYLKIKEKLRRMQVLADVAIQPYKMMESDALEMVAWESGTRIENLKKMIANDPEPS